MNCFGAHNTNMGDDHRFMQSDPWWSFAMAVNVYLVFFFNASPSTFRRYLWIYAIVCFGLPMVPAIVCLVADNGESIYGDATVCPQIQTKWWRLRGDVALPSAR